MGWKMDFWIYTYWLHWIPPQMWCTDHGFQRSSVVVEMVERRRWRDGGAGGVERVLRWWWWWALVTLGEEPKSVNLVYKIDHTGPPTKPKTNHKHPNHHKDVDCIGTSPSSQVLWWLLHCVLHPQNTPTFNSTPKSIFLYWRNNR